MSAEPVLAEQPGGTLLAEIREQPEALRRLLEHAGAYAEVAAEARRRRTTLVRMIGHGSSDNAASYGVYAFGLLPGWSAMRDSISLSVYYGASVDLTGSCVVALSQSGQTPDVLEYVERARARGAYTVAITNEPDSALAHAAAAVLPLAAGPERSVAATKTYVNQLAALALLAGYAAGRGDELRAGIVETSELLGALVPRLERTK
jgi:glutamine---fructose-6-phosphate transaminase (isomerizing)